MPLRTVDQNPSITDTVLFDLYTRDENDELVDPYKVDSITIFFVERDYVSKDLSQWDESISNNVTTFFYRDAVPIKTVGTDDFPAYLSTDLDNAFVTRVDVGHFQLEWRPELCREGDYFICHTWTPISAGDSFSNISRFYLSGDPQPPVIPSHLTNPDKYPTLFERWTPEMFKRTLAEKDLTPEVIEKHNLAVADGFTQMENFYNQLIDLFDANVVNEAFLPYLANFFRLKLRSQDPTLWRRQTKNAIPLYKKRGTIDGLKEALSQSGITFKKLTYYWQVVSKATWQEAFTIIEDDDFEWRLAKRAILPVDDYNFSVWYRVKDTTTWVEVSADDYELTNASESMPGCPEDILGYTLFEITSSSVISALEEGDMVRILYKFAEPEDQQVETYIQSLSLADGRDEMEVTTPLKNWNVRLIAEDDALFPVVCPQSHAFNYPLVYGKIRTEFPYNENSYNMDEYNGGVYDSHSPCDIDASFSDICTCCRSSKISIDVEIENLSSDRIEECEEVIKDFVPFHAQIHSINYVGLQDELIPPPVEELECLIQYNFQENVICSQFDFNRIIFDGKDDTNILKRNEIAEAESIATGTDGVANNLAITIFSPGKSFKIVKDGDNLLEVLSGTHQGEYELARNGGTTADVVGLTDYPLDQSGFPFRFSNIQYEEAGVSVYQDDVVLFSDADVDFSFYPIPNTGTWKIVITSGPNAGDYPVLDITSDNSLILSGWSGGTASSQSYDLEAAGSINITSGTTGSVSVKSRGRVVTGPVRDEWDVKKGDWVEFGGEQYKLLFIERPDSINDYLYIDDYSDGDQVGAINIRVLRRHMDDAVGYFNYRGMKLTTTINYESTLGIQDGQNPVANPVENSDFKANYLVLIGSTYYQLSDIDGTELYLVGPVLDWGVDDDTTGLSYTIIQLTNNAVTPQNGRTGEFNTFEFIDRRGEGSIFVIEQDVDAMSMDYKLQLLNNQESIEQSVKTKEQIWFTVEFKKD